MGPWRAHKGRISWKFQNQFHPTPVPAPTPCLLWLRLQVILGRGSRTGSPAGGNWGAALGLPFGNQQGNEVSAETEVASWAQLLAHD